MPQVIADFFEVQVKDKLPAASIFARTDGAAWNKDAWKYPVKDAVRAAGLPGASSAYTLRHSVITDLIRARLPKGALLNKLSKAFAKHASAASGELGLASAAPDYQAALVLFGDMDASLPSLMSGERK